MISGYNTDVPHGDVVYHVQTEDMGSGKAWIESLVYVGGEILARKRSSYKRVLEGGGGEDEVVRLMDRQHRSLIAGIRGGKFDQGVSDEGPDSVPRVAGETDSPPADEAYPQDAVAGGAKTPQSGPEPASSIAEPGEMAEADYSELPLDQAILEFLNSRQEQDEMLLAVDATTELGLGRNVDLAFQATSRLTGKPVPAAKVEVRMISTVAEPLHLAKGDTDADGTLELSFRIPRLQRGSGALIITARSELGAAEMKHLL